MDCEETFVTGTTTGAFPGPNKRRDSVWRYAGHQLHGAAPLIVAIILLAVPRTTLWAAVPQGVWLMDLRVALQIFDCGSLLCGRILWLLIPRNPQGELDRDKNNPNPALRQRLLCGLTVLWGLRPAGPDRWQGGWFYNPDDGRTYDVSARLKSADVLIARIYLGRTFPDFECKSLMLLALGCGRLATG